MVFLMSLSSVTGIILAGGKSKRFSSSKLELKIGKVTLLFSQLIKLCHFCDEILVSTNRENYKAVRKEVDRLLPSGFLMDSEADLIKHLPEKGVPEIKVILDEEWLGEFENLSLYSRACSPGPIGGIYSGLKNAKNFYSIVVALDMPFISYAFLGFLLESIISKPNVSESSVGKDERESNKEKVLMNRTPDVVVVRTEKGFETLCAIYSKNCLEVIEENIKRKMYKISDVFTGVFTRVISEDSLKKAGIGSLNFFNINTSRDYKYFMEVWERGVFGNDSCNISSRFCEKWKNFFYRENGSRT